MDQPATILIIDDDSSTLGILSLILKNTGYNVEVNDGNDGIKSPFPDLVLLDNNLGPRSGITICRELKNNPSTMNIPVIIISAMQDIREIFHQAGADNYLSKPFGINQLLEIVEATLVRRASDNG